MKMEQTECSETSAYKVQTPGNYPTTFRTRRKFEIKNYTIFCIIVDALHVSGSFSAHHQELKNCTHSIWYVPGLLQQSWHVPDAMSTVLELLMMGGETARNV
jgi:ribosomal silencing factor RsfS